MKTSESNRYPLSARSCVKRRKRAPRETRGGEDQRRRREARAASGVIPRSQKLISMEGRLGSKGGPFARRALSRAYEASRKAANEDEAREAENPREKDGPKRYRSFWRFSRGWRGKMAGAGDWGRSIEPPRKSLGRWVLGGEGEGEEHCGADASRGCRRVFGRRAGGVRPGAGGHTSSRMYNT